MVFSSLLFLFRFLPAVLLVYYLAPRRLRNGVLLVFSLVFYAWGEPVYLGLMLLSILIAYAGGRLIGRFRRLGRERAAQAALLVCGGTGLALLGFFKYADFALETANRLFGTNLPLPKLALPIGISFYTFQTLSYLLDVYRGQAPVQRNPFTFGTYVAMFPQLIAGPIVQYKTIDAELRCRRETPDQFAAGCRRFVLGLGKKVLLANNIGALWEVIRAMDPAALPAATAWLGLGAFTLQIYFDFSAYSDMAIGLGLLFGFHFLENFDAPYRARSITEFWRRWHISLGRWFREYVYIPLGGNRAGRWRQVRNILVVWLLTGIWHGASWNFIAWGLYYGVLLLAEKFVLARLLGRLPAWLQHLYCLVLVMLGWNLFAFEDLRQGAAFFRALVGGGGLLCNGETVYLLYNHLALLAVCLLACTALPRRLATRLKSSGARSPLLPALGQSAVLAGVFLLSVAWLVDATYNPFLYFRF